MRAWWIALVVAMVPASAHAEPSYIEKFVGWSKDNAFYVITASGTDEMSLPVLCVSKRGDTPASWPKDIPLPDKDDDRGCTETSDEVFDREEAEALVAKATGLVVTPGSKSLHGEAATARKVGDGSLVEITVARGKKVLGKGYVVLRDKSAAIPDELATYWRADGLAAAVEAGYPAPSGDNPGFGPPAFLVVIPLDGSAANVARPKTPREQSRALNLAGMKLLKAGQLDDAQKQFVTATQADGSFATARYNLASVASLRKDSSKAVAAMLKVIELATSDADAKRAVAKAKTDHDLDYIASESPYVAKLLGRPRTKGDDWCIAAEKRARDLNLGNFNGVAEGAAPVIDATAVRGGIRGDKDPEFSCHVGNGASQFSITMYVWLSDKNKHERIVRIAWEIFPDGTFDADAFVDEKQAKTIRLEKLEGVARISKTIAGGK